METPKQTCTCTRSINRWGTFLLITPIRFYQYFFSPWLGHRCRFFPTCSHYGIEALHQYGAIKGLGLIFCRVAKCHPWHRGGYDPVPTPTTNQQKMVNK